jgi:hypothetical protein
MLESMPPYWAGFAEFMYRSYGDSRTPGRAFTHPHKPPNRLSYIAIAETFFARHLGGACEPVCRDFDDSSHEVRAGGEILSETGAR